MEARYSFVFILIVCSLHAYCVPAQVIETARHRVKITILDDHGAETAARLKLTRANRSITTPPGESIAVMYGQWDHADGFAFQPDSSFYVNQSFVILLDAGEYQLHVSKGFEYLDQDITVHLPKDSEVVIKMKRWVDMNKRGWYSADDHIHVRRSPREDSLLLEWIKAENVNVGVLLRMGDFWSTYYEQYAWGKKGAFQKGNFMLTSGQEDPRTPEVGHTLSLAADGKSRFQNQYYLYDRVFDEIHRLNGITGYAHQAESFHGYRGLMLDGLRNKVDALELIQFCVSATPLLPDHYYHMLNMGFKLTALAGSDFPWCGRDHSRGRPDKNARIGDARFYTYIKNGLSFDNWRDALSKGHTFATTGPMLLLNVDEAIPGDSLNLKRNSEVTVRVKAIGHQKSTLEKVELVKFGKVIATKLPTNDSERDSLSWTFKLKVEEGCWFAARCYSGAGRVAHTTPVYIYLEGKRFHDQFGLKDNIALAEKYLAELEDDLKTVSQDAEKQSWRYRKPIENRIKEARDVLTELRKKIE